MVTEQPTVTYRDIPDFPGYRVGDDGSVWTNLVRCGPGKNGRGSGMVPGDTWRQLKPASQPNGSQYLSIRTRSYLVHRLILLAFVGPCPKGMEACHADGNPANNRLSNLRWDTHAANESDKIRHGTSNRGERSGLAKITADVVRAIRSEYAAGGISQAQLAKKHGLGQMQVCRIIRRERWAHIV